MQVSSGHTQIIMMGILGKFRLEMEGVWYVVMNIDWGMFYSVNLCINTLN